MADWLLEHMAFHFVAKDVRSARGNGVFLIENGCDWRQYDPANEVLYVQEYLPIRQDMRLVVIGRQVVAGYWPPQPTDCQLADKPAQ